MKPKAAIFDLGGVIVDVESDRLMAIAAQLSGLSFDEVLAAVYHPDLLQFELGRLSPEQYYAGLKSRIRLPWTFEQFVGFWNDILREKRDVTALVERLHGRCRLLVLSNTNILHMRYMKAIVPVLSKFDHLVGSYEVGACKPNPSVYRAVIERSGVEPAEAVYFDDRLEMVEGGRCVGLRAIRFEHARKLEQDLRDVGLLD